MDIVYHDKLTDRRGGDKCTFYSSNFQFPVRMVDEGDSSSQDLLNGNAEAEDELQKVMVSVPLHGARDVTLQIKLNFPEGVTLNEEAPNKWKIESHGESITNSFSSVIVYGLL